MNKPLDKIEIYNNQTKIASTYNLQDTNAQQKINQLQKQFEQPIQEQVNNWLNNHPEATTTVQDGSLIKTKFSDELKLQTIKDYVTPQMFGAKGDGIIDDTQSFLSALNTSNIVFIPSGNYKLTSSIHLSYGKKLLGCNKIDTTLSFVGGGIVIDGNFTTIENLSIKNLDTSKTGQGISFTNNTTHMVSIKDILIYYYESGIYNTSQLWNCTFESIRINDCSIGLNFEGTQTSFSVCFLNVYIANSNKTARFSGLNGIFNSCNFSIMDSDAFIVRYNSKVVFMGCNFECDKHEVNNGTVFSLVSMSVKFIECTFSPDLGKENHFFETGSNVTQLIFDSCFYKPKIGNNMPDENFFNRAGLKAYHYGAIEFVNGNYNIPRATNIYQSQIPLFKDSENGSVIHYNTIANVDTSMLIEGSIYYNRNTKKMGYWTGKSMIEF